MSRVDEMRELTGELAANHADRRQALDNMSREVNLQRVAAAMAHAAMAAEQRAILTADRVNRHQAVEAMRADLNLVHAAMAAEQKATLTADRAALRQAMDALLADLAVVHAAMATEQKATLTADRVNRHQAVAIERTDLRRSLNQMAQVWLEFAAAMHGNTVAAQPEPAPPAPLATEPSTEEVLPAEDVDDRLLVYLAEHAEGVKLVELEPVFELSRPQLGRHLRALVDSGKVVKDSETLIYTLA